ncbi:hypothetical protein KTR10_00960 [Candidatus Kaiserbacteria bacterium]|nr:hypothetical protein [Candidatus Kaiserbacteria bacterium]
MLYSFFGTDVIATRANAQEFIASEKEKGASVTRFTGNNWTVGDMEQALGGTSLFGDVHLFVLDTPGDNTDMQTYIFKHIKEIAESPNTFVLLEEKLLAPQKKKVEKYSEQTSEYTLEKEKPFNIFALADALLQRDKKSLWILYTQAQRAGHSSEEIVGTLFWQVKMIALANRTQGAEEAGVSNFPYGKAKRALHHFSEEDIETMLTQLVTIYHEGHGGVKDMDGALEEWILQR